GRVAAAGERARLRQHHGRGVRLAVDVRRPVDALLSRPHPRPLPGDPAGQGRSAPDDRPEHPVTTTHPPATLTAPRPSQRRARIRETIAGYAFLLPWLLGFFLLTFGPMVVSLYLSFTDYDLFEANWVGLDNYTGLFSDPRYLKSVQVTVTYVLISTPVKLVAALLVAMLLNARRRGLGFYRSAFYAPSLVAASISIAIVWKAMFVDDAAVDSFLQIFGIDTGGWVGNQDLTMPMFVLLALWSFGGPMVIFLAGLKQVPTELYEAAEMDGAGAFRRFLPITVPMMGPVI